MRVLALLTLFASAAAFSPVNDASSVRSRTSSSLNYMQELVQQERIERKLIAEEIRKNGVQLQLTEPTYSASIKDEVQQRGNGNPTGEQEFQDAQRYLLEQKGPATKQASPFMGLFKGK
jgi:hypothetical protein